MTERLPSVKFYVSPNSNSIPVMGGALSGRRNPASSDTASGWSWEYRLIFASDEWLELGISFDICLWANVGMIE